MTVNGRAVNLDPPPIVRAGRLFVPLRGVFEDLGASVVFANGQINATGSGHIVSLHIGSQQAFVDGQTEGLDAAPFIVGSSAYVPLRFVSQALGALVNYDGRNQVVAISTGAEPPPQTVTPPPTAPPTPPPTVPPTAPPQRQPGGQAPPPPPAPTGQSPVHVTHELPADDATVRGARPDIEAAFEGDTIDPNSVHVEFDGRDVTQAAYVSAHGFTYTRAVADPAGTARRARARRRHDRRDVRAALALHVGRRGRAHDGRRGPAASGRHGGATVHRARASGSRRDRDDPGRSTSRGQRHRADGRAVRSGSPGAPSMQKTPSPPTRTATSPQGSSIGAPSGTTLVIVINATNPETGIATDPDALLIQVHSSSAPRDPHRLR